MGIFDRLLSKYIQKAVAERQRAIGDPVYEAIMRYIGQNNPAYLPDNIEGYVEGYTSNPIVYSIVSFIAQKAGTIPWFVYDVKDKKALRLYKSGTPEVTIQKQLLRHKAMEPIEDHELMQLFNTPNPLQGWAEFIEQAVGFKLVTGNTYVHAIGPTNGVNAGMIQELWNLPSQIIEIMAGDRTKPVKGYRYIPDKSVVIPPEEIIHLKYWTPDYLAGSHLYGMSPIRAGRKVVTKSDASFDAGTSAMQNSGMIGFISGNEEQTGVGLTDEQVMALRERLDEYSKPTNRGKIPITAYGLKWNQMGMSPVDLAIIESDKMDLRALCNIYHVPSELFNDASNKTYSNTKEAARAIWVNAVIPQLTQFRDAFNNYVSRRYGGDLWVDYDTSVVPELQDDLSEQVAGLKEAYWISPNEKREIMQWDPDPAPEMDMIWIPAGLTPINGWMEQQEQAAIEAEAQLAELNATDEEVEDNLKRLGIE